MASGRRLIVNSQAPEADQPGKDALHDPAARYRHEAMRGWGFAGDMMREVQARNSTGNLLIRLCLHPYSIPQHLLLLAGIALAMPATAQKADPVAASTATEFPQNEGKLYYEGVVEVAPTSKKADLYRMERTWFVDNYVSAKEVL